MSEDRRWYIHTSKGQEGPFTPAEIRIRRSTGYMGDDDQVWRDGFRDWRRLGDTPEAMVRSVPPVQPPGSPQPMLLGVIPETDKLRPVAVIQPGSLSVRHQSLFEHDLFLLRQKYLSISEKYDVTDRSGRIILFVQRPRYIFRNILVGALAAVLFGVVFVASLMPLKSDFVKANPVVAPAAVFALAVFLSCLCAFSVWYKLAPRRHVRFTVAAGQGPEECVLEVLEDSVFQFPTVTYSVLDADGRRIGLFRKNVLVSLVRASWDCLTPAGIPLFNAMEDSIILSLLRRLIGPFFGILRTNFILFRGDGEDDVVGKFNRTFTLLDRYVLDLSADSKRTLDRRLLLAMGVMLDTGERR